MGHCAGFEYVEHEVNMGSYFSAGGMFMTPLTILGIVMLLLMIKKAVDLFGKSATVTGKGSRDRVQVNLMLQFGVLAFFLGILSQAIGLMDAFQAIEAMGGVSPAMLVGGLRVSMIAPVYGLIILIVAFVGWMVLKNRLDSIQTPDITAVG